MSKRRQSRGGEIANSVSHGVGSAAAVAATPFFVLAARNDSAAAVVGVSIFAATMIVLYAIVWHLCVLCGTTCHVCAVLGSAV